MVKYLGISKDEKHLRAMKALAKQEIARIQKEKQKKNPPSGNISAGDILKPPSNDIKKSTSCDAEKYPSLKSLSESQRVIEGFHDIFSPVFDELNLSETLSAIREKQLKDVVILRIATPCSKSRTAGLLKRNYAKLLSEDQIYRLMDAVANMEQTIKLKIFKATKSHCEDQTVTVLFFDVTTLYYESQDNDGLREFGYSKDHKIGETQVVLALATTAEGLPIGYSLFPGNTAEVKTLLHCLEEWRRELKIERAVVVADRAMMSEKNLQEMEAANLKYVIAAKLRSLPSLLKKTVLARQSETECLLDSEPVRLQELNHNGRRIIVSFSESRAQKDRSDRERLLERLRKSFDEKGESQTRKLVSNRGFLKYTREKEKGQLILNEAQIELEAQWDGLHGVITNDTSTRAVELLQRYRGLWVIEESFRINKHSLAIRPIYHFKPQRIRAHILICYIAFALSRFVQQKVGVLDERLSVEKIREVLSGVEASILEDQETGQLYRMPSKFDRKAATIYRAMGVQRVQQISAV